MFDETSWGMCFDRDDVIIIGRYLSLHTYEPGQYIFRQGERQHYMAFIVRGQVDILKESQNLLEKIVVSLSAGTHFGEMAFIDEEPRSASAVARQRTELLVISRKNFDEIVVDHPQVAIKMLKEVARMISRRLRMTTGQMVYLRN
jgi:CRP-like cAMP-binding protein